MSDSSAHKRPRLDDGSSPAVEADQLNNLLEQMKGYEATIPDEVVSYLLKTSGCDIKDERMSDIRLVALATQRFIFSIADDAQQICRARNKSGPKDASSSVLKMEDLSVALANASIDVYKPEYYADHLANQ